MLENIGNAITCLPMDRLGQSRKWFCGRGVDWMRPPKFRPSRSIGRQVMALPVFSNMAAVRHIEF